MVKKVITHVKYPALIAGIVLCLVGVALRPGSGQAYAATGNIDPNNKYAWGTNVGWINFSPTHGGVTVYADHLEGYAWGENVGWIRLGSYDGGGAHTYANTSATDYGVNRDGDGNLSGYAWGTNVGWIKFDPTHGGVTIDPDTGSFDGYAWGENVGWIHFKNAAPEYNVVTTFREENLPKPAVAKSVSPTSAKPGQAITYTIAFSNTGDITATNVVITDALSANIIGASYSSSGVALTQVPGSRYVWIAPGLGQNEGGVITITGVLTKPLAAGIFSNTVTMAVSGTQKVVTTPLTVQNVAPVADAGLDQSKVVSQTVTLDGSGSSDDNGDTLIYGWTQTGGSPTVTLSDPAAQKPTFTAPSAVAVLTFTLTVTDTGTLASTDEVVVTVVENYIYYFPIIFKSGTP